MDALLTELAAAARPRRRWPWAVAALGVSAALTGGALANPRLAEGLVAGLAGLDVRRHGEVPPGDGGLSLGQAVWGRRMLAAGRSTAC